MFSSPWLWALLCLFRLIYMLKGALWLGECESYPFFPALSFWRLQRPPPPTPRAAPSVAQTCALTDTCWQSWVLQAKPGVGGAEWGAALLYPMQSVGTHPRSPNNHCTHSYRHRALPLRSLQKTMVTIGKGEKQEGK